MPFDTHKTLVDLSSVGIYRNDRWLIRNIDLKIHLGEIVTLIGPNGSGKTTTSKVALGLLKPDEGQVSTSPDLSIGYVPQSLKIDPSIPITVKRLLTLARHHSTKEISHALHLVGADKLANAQVQHLSGGEFQRVLLARAIINKPDLLVLDEPAQGIDFNGELVIYELIKTIRQETGCGILLVSHDLHMVMAQTDTVVCLNGHVCCTGTPHMVAADPEYVRLFGQRAIESLAVYHHDHDHIHLDDGRVQHADGSITDHCHHLDGHHKSNHQEDKHHHKTQTHNHNDESPDDHAG